MGRALIPFVAVRPGIPLWMRKAIMNTSTQNRDNSLYSGERQVTQRIRADHLARYRYASEQLFDTSVLDLGCGVGYGTRLLAEKNDVLGIDISAETIAYARSHYAHPRARYLSADLNHTPPLNAHAAVAFEVIEHLEDPRPLLTRLANETDRLIVSVPDEDGYPWRQPNGRTVAFHYRHYTRVEFVGLLSSCGWHVMSLHTQAGPHSELKTIGPETPAGRTLVADCITGRLFEAQGTSHLHLFPAELAPAPDLVPDDVPEHVAILGLGPSLEEYVNIAKRLGGKHVYCDEVWGINAVAGVIMCDRVFHMDDVRIQEIRAQALPESNIARMLEWLRVHPGPVVTSRAHPDYPGLVEFPLEAVLNHLGHDYFNSTAAYAVAYAIHIGVKKISLFGCDYTYPNAHDAERGRACVEFWLGVARARGIQIAVAKQSSLLDALHTRAERLYGYDAVEVDVRVRADGRVNVVMTERADLPTAQEIEDRYDHSAHPNTLVEGSTG